METYFKKFNLRRNVPMRDILSFYEASKKFNGKCQLRCRKKIIETTNLPNLVSFFLTANSRQAVHIKIEGRQIDSFRETLFAIID